MINYYIWQAPPKFVCVDCKILRSQFPSEEQFPFRSMSWVKEMKCGECGKQMIKVDPRFRPPRRHKSVDWAKIIRPFRLDSGRSPR